MFDLYQRQTWETDYEWKERLIVGKLTGQNDLTWEQIREILSLNIGSHQLRKQARGILEAYNYYHPRLQEFEDNAVTDKKAISKIEWKKQQLELERKRVQAIKLEYNRLLREEGRRIEMVEEIHKVLRDNTLEVPEFYELPNDSDSKRTGVLAVSDIHFGKSFESLNNTHSKQRVLEKMNILLNEVINICKKEGFDKLIVINCGDSIDGLLRISQISSLEMGVIEQTIQYSRMMAEWLNSLSKFVEIDYYHVPSANHSEIRPLGTRAGQFPREDMETLIMNYVADVLKDNERINIPIEEKHNFVQLDIQGFNVLCYHGHQFGKKKPDVLLKDLTALHQVFVDFVILGHLHHTEIISVASGEHHNKQILYVPSIMGSDQYSDQICRGAYAGAIFFIFEKNRGKTQSYEIMLD